MRRLIALTAALIAAFVLAPGPVAALGTDSGFADHSRFTAALREAFAGYWQTGRRGPQLDRLVEFWLRYHVVKGALAALVLAVLVPLGLRLARHRGKAALAGLAAVTGLGLLALVTVAANVQGALVPLSSLLPMVIGSEPLAGAPEPAVLGALVADFGRYHEVMAVIAAVLAIVLVTAAILLWRRFAATDAAERRTRRLLGALGTVTALTALAVLLVVVANATTAADPGPALRAFFDGGW
ncbi:hypothetical protein GCM10020218_055330 [Dactylosporangium vinaceum]|uniref:Uncharacterized protein n=1 Tax=Dactylosporangium vinaceum TaxID=53362 RepID=A0ABV5MKM2_9ACTN|nr:hypothetical protein [Dactylosporangium vinaceum]